MATMTRRWCSVCNAYVAAERPKISHLLHFIITVTTCGLWGWVWLLLVLTNGTWRCRTCGAKTAGSPTERWVLGGGAVFLAGFMAIFGLTASYMMRQRGEKAKAEPANMIQAPVEVPEIAKEPAQPNPVVPLAENKKAAENIPDVPDVVAANPEAAEEIEKPVAEKPVDEQRNKKAAGKLATAKPLIGKNNTAAKKRLNEIIVDFDGTPAADEARLLLKKLN